jgi:hypothetical protein
MVIDNLNIGKLNEGYSDPCDNCIEPRRSRKRFRSQNWPDAAGERISLYEICRQIYVDAVGGGLLYKFQKFFFGSQNSMFNYLWVIRPYQKNALHSIEMNFRLIREEVLIQRLCLRLLSYQVCIFVLKLNLSLLLGH